VSNVIFLLWKGGTEIFPVCSDVDSMCLMCNYSKINIYYWSLEIFKSTFCSYLFFYWFWDKSSYWSL